MMSSNNNNNTLLNPKNQYHRYDDDDDDDDNGNGKNSNNNSSVSSSSNSRRRCCCGDNENENNNNGWSYPIHGILYLLLFQSTSSTLYRSIVINNICWIILPTIGIVMILFNKTFTQQIQLISSLGNNDEVQWFDVVFAFISILIQSTIIVLRLMQFIVKKNAIRIFVQVIKEHNYWNYNTMIEPDYSPCSNCCCCSCSLINNGNFRGLSSWIISIFIFPLFIFINPIIGTIVYALVNAPFAAWDYLDYYFDINPLQYDNNKQRSMLLYGNNTNNTNTSNSNNNTIIMDDNNNGDGRIRNSSNSCCCCCCLPSNNSIMYRYNLVTNSYSQFGFICSIMEIIPILGPSIFVLTNACGTALFVINTLPNPNNNNNIPSSSSPTNQQQQQQQQEMV